MSLLCDVLQGARLHSDSWGSSDIDYDYMAAQVDAFSWANQDFLAMFAAGNDGQTVGVGGQSGVTTVTSPATAKNCISVGATQTTGDSMQVGAVSYVVFDATVSQGGQQTSTFRVLQAGFGGRVSSLNSRSYRVLTASPLRACSSLQNAAELGGAVVLIERGAFLDKFMLLFVWCSNAGVENPMKSVHR